MQVLPYAEDELVLVVPPDSALAGLPAIDKSQLRSLTFLSLDQGATVQVGPVLLEPGAASSAGRLCGWLRLKPGWASLYACLRAWAH